MNKIFVELFDSYYVYNKIFETKLMCNEKLASN